MTTGIDPILLNQTTSGDQSPPEMVKLPDGRLFYVWTDAAQGDTTSTTLQGRIFAADGTPLTDQFALGGWAVDGSDGFDFDNMSLNLLANGNVMVSYVRSGWQGDGSEPVFSIFNPSVTPGTSGFTVIQNVEIQQSDIILTTESPPVTTVLADGRILFVWSKGGLSDDSSGMTVWGRIYNADGTASTNEFQIGSVAVDGSDGFDTDAITVTQLAGGNVVIGVVRSYVNAGGDEPVYSIINPAIAPTSAGFAVVSDIEMQQTDTTVWESAPVITALSDGRWMAVWAKDGYGDGATMTLQGRIFNANGTAATDEFRIGSTATDGNDAYDTDNITITQLSNGNVVVGYVDTGTTGGKESPFFNIINPSVTPGTAGFAVTGDVKVNALSTSLATEVGPPVIAALPGSGGNFVVAWVDGNATSNVLKYQIYDGSGTALTPEMIATQADGSGISNSDSFDWDNLQIVPLDSTRFVINWVGSSDGSGTGAFSTGAISIDGQAAAGVVDGTSGADSITGTWADAGGDSVNGADGLDDSIAGNGGNDTLDGGAGSDTLNGGAGDDRLILSRSSGAGNWADLPDQIANDPLQVNTAITGHQSPPKVVELADGRVLYIWVNDGASDDISTMTLQGRIFTANGLPATDQFTLTSWPVDGSDGYDSDALNVDMLNNGNVLISYVRNYASAGVIGQDEPVFSIINPSVTPNGTGFYVAQNVEFQQNDITSIEGPPVVEVLSDGRIFAVWTRNALSDDLTSMDVQGRIFNADGTPSTNEFSIGTWASDGYNGDTPSLTVSQLAGGNVVVAYVRATGETGGDEPVFSVVNPAITPGSAGFAVISDVEMQQTDTTTYESPPVITALSDGRFMSVWVKDYTTDNAASMTVQGRIFNADGTAATNEFQVGTMAIDGWDGYDTDNLVIENIGNGRVVVGYVESGVTGGTENPVISVIDTTATPGSPGFTLVSGATINLLGQPAASTIGPPVIEALDDGTGRFVAAWSDGISSSNAIKFRVFDNSGNPLSGEVTVTTADGAGLSSIDNFDWENLTVTATGEGKFIISWVGADDGNGTGVQTSGPIDADEYCAAGNEVLIGGESGETVGDTLDASAMTGSVRVTYTGTESGTLAESGGGMAADGVSTIANARMEMFVFDRSAWTDPASVLRDSTSSGSGATGSTLTLNSYSGTKAGLDIGYVDDVAYARLAQGITLNGTSFASNATVEMDYGFVVQDARGYQYFVGKIDVGGNIGGYDGSVITSGWDPVSQTWVGAPAAGTQFTLINASGYPWSGASNVVASSSLSPYSNDVRLGAAIDAPIVEGTSTTASTASFSEIEHVTLGSGQDTVDASAATGGVDVAAGGGNDSLTGGTGGDTLAGDAGNDRISGGAGNDSLLGGTGNDVLTGGEGADTLTGGDGNDLLTGDGNLLRNGGLEYNVANNSNVQGYATDWANSGGWLEVWGSGQGGITAAEGSNFVELDVESGVDTLYQDVTTTAGQSYTLTFSATQRSGAYNDSVEVWWNGAKVSTVTPGATWGTYTVTVTGTGGSTRLEFRELSAENTSTGVLLDNISLLGGGGADSLLGEAGNDTLLGGVGNDTLDGGTGNDSLSGEAGDDLFRLSSATGSETILGGETGETTGDTLDASGLATGVTLTLSTPESGTLTASGLTVSFSEVERTVLTAAADTAMGSTGADIIDGSGGNDSLSGGAGNDLLLGGDGNDTIYDGAGSDTIYGGAGNDLIDDAAGYDATAEANLVYGEGGNDTIWGSSGSDTLYGGSDDDQIGGESGNDFVFGGDGRDSLTGGGGADSLSGDAGNDTVHGEDGNDTVSGGAGADVVIGGLGDDSVLGDADNDSLTGELGNDTLSGGSGDDQLGGSDGTDLLSGDAGNDLLFGENDADTLLGGDGDDMLLGGAGNDSLSGGDGEDALFGDAGNDSLSGGAGADYLVGGAGNDTVSGDAGDDSFALGAGDSAAGGDGDDVFYFENSLTGTQTITVTGGEAVEEDILDAGNNPDGRIGDALDLRGLPGVTITYNTADPTWNGVTAESGTATYTNTAGQTVTIQFSQIEQILTDLDGKVDGTTGDDVLVAGYADAQGDLIDGWDGANDSILAGAGNDSVEAGAGNDTVLGDAGNDLVSGQVGNDLLIGGEGADSVSGGDGNDTVQGGDGDDLLIGGAGADLIEGGAGNDRITFDNPFVGSEQPGLEGGGDTVLGGAGASDNDTLDLRGAGPVILVTETDPDDAGAVRGTATFQNGTVLTFSGIETIQRDNDGVVDGTAGDDTMGAAFADPQGDAIDGWDGAEDSILAGAGNDSVLAGAGNDNVSGGTGDDTVGGGDGDDSLQADEGNDSISGGAGNDYIDGWTGNDTASGGAGDDDLFGFDGDDSLSGDDGEDGVWGEDGVDTLEGGAGNDTLGGGTGNDLLSGGDGRDLLLGAEGADTLTGGAGADIFVADGTADRITDFDTTTGISGNGNADNDFVDLTQFYNPTTLLAWNAANPSLMFDTPLDWLRHDAQDGVLTQAGGLIIENNGAAVGPRTLTGENTGVICFARGTRIATAQGPVAVENLREGDRIKTRDAGFQPIRWIGSTTVSGLDTDAPVVIAPGTFGNRRALTVSPRHRMLVTGWEVQTHLGLDDVFVPARQLLDGQRVRQVPQARVEYFHLLLDQHQVIFAEGAESESFHPGAEGWKTLSDAARAEILDRFPALATGFDAYGPTARPVATGREAAMLCALRGTAQGPVTVTIPASVTAPAPAPAPSPALSATVIRMLERFAAMTADVAPFVPDVAWSTPADRAA